MDKFTENLINKLDCNNIKQKSKLSCNVAKWAEFLVFILIIVLDSFLFSLIFFYIKEVDYDIVKSINQPVLLFLPYFWITLFLGIIVLSYFYFYYKLKGYRLNFVFSFGSVLLITAGFGFGISCIRGLNESTDEALSLAMPHYYNTIFNDNVWGNCCDGIDCDDCLIGRLRSINISQDREIMSLFDDRNKRIISIVYDGNIKNIYKCNFVINNRYKIIAKRLFDGSYKVLAIRPWHKDECPNGR